MHYSDCLSELFRRGAYFPGIAGIVLTIGMAVDSNVLIFERIREEVRAGKAPSSGRRRGFRKALLTIIDTHVTTVVSCAILFLFGSGPVKGFAVTLVIGLVANVFTAVFVSKAIFDWEFPGPHRSQLSVFSTAKSRRFSRPHQLGTFVNYWCLFQVDAGLWSSMEIFKQTNFDFLGKKWPFITLSLLLTATGVDQPGCQGGPKYGIDFNGGALMDVNFKNGPRGSDPAALHKKISGEIEVQEIGTHKKL